jgi:hypothetical protein
MAAVLIVALAAGIALSRPMGGGGSKKVSHAAYMQMYTAAVPGKTENSILDQWPKPPYQSYHDNFNDHCYQWIDKPVALYNLCFKDGKLVSKDLE